LSETTTANKKGFILSSHSLVKENKLHVYNMIQSVLTKSSVQYLTFAFSRFLHFMLFVHCKKMLFLLSMFFLFTAQISNIS